MLCLTVYECKGLEFDEVILFNFFQDSKCLNQWKLLNDIVFSQQAIKKSKETEFLDFEMLEAQEVEEDFAVVNHDKIGKNGEEQKKEQDLEPGQMMIDTSGN